MTESHQMMLRSALLIGLCLFAFGISFRLHFGPRRSLTLDYVVRLGLIAFGASAFCAYSLAPVLSMAWVYVQYGGSLRDYLLDDARDFLTGLAIVVLLGAFWIVKGYIDALRWR